MNKKDIYKTIQKGKDATRDFINDYGPDLIKSAAILGLSAAGMAYVTPIVSKAINDFQSAQWAKTVAEQAALGYHYVEMDDGRGFWLSTGSSLSGVRPTS